MGRRNMIWDLIFEDRMMRAVVVMLLTISTIVLTVASVAVWPALLTVYRSDTAYRDFASLILITGIGLLVADAIIAFILSWYDSGYSFLKAILCTYLLGFVVMLIAVFIKPLELPVILEDSTSFSLLSGIVKVFLAVVLAFLPALAASVIGWIIREVYYVVSQIR